VQDAADEFRNRVEQGAHAVVEKSWREDQTGFEQLGADADAVKQGVQATVKSRRADQAGPDQLEANADANTKRNESERS